MPPAVSNASNILPTPTGTAPGTTQVTKPNPYGGLSGAQVTADDAAAKTQDALWYTFTGIGRAYLVSVGSTASGQADLYGAHGYSTIEQAYDNPNSGAVNASSGAGPSQALITIWDGYASLPVGGGTLGLVETVNITAPTAGTVAAPGTPATSSTQQNPTTQAANKLLGAGEAIEHFFDAVKGFFDLLTDKDMWISLAWLLFGAVLLALGITMFVRSRGAANG